MKTWREIYTQEEVEVEHTGLGCAVSNRLVQIFTNLKIRKVAHILAHRIGISENLP